MTIVHFKFSEGAKHVYLKNLDIISFLEFWNVASDVKIGSIYFSDSRYYYDQREKPISTVSQLIQFINDNRDLRINSLKFECGKYAIDINDVNEYTIYASENELDSLLKYILSELLGVDPGDREKTLSLDNKYLIIDNGKVIETFNSFDEYLESPYD